MLVRPAPTNAEELYQQSMEDLEGGLYPEALKGFSDLKTQYPYTKYAALADLRTADTHFQRAKYIEAVDAYRNFLKFHPNHEEAPYAMLQIGEAYYEQIPEDWFFLPASAEKDQGNTKLAITAYRDMLSRYPNAKVSDQARERLNECRAKLAEHELYVAKFYLKREVYKAAAGRAEYLLENFADLGFDEEALWIAGRSRFEGKEWGAAHRHLAMLRDSFPEGKWFDEAGDLMADIPPSSLKGETSSSPTWQAPGKDASPSDDVEARGAQGE